MGLTAAAAVAVDGDNVAPEIDPSAGDAPKIRRETVLGGPQHAVSASWSVIINAIPPPLR